MEEERIEAVKTLPKSQLVRDIQVFLGFTNFYRRLLRNFREIAKPLILTFQTTNETIGKETQSIRAKK